MRNDERHESLSSRALDALLKRKDDDAKAMKMALEDENEGVHRTVLWRYRTGTGKPGVEGAAKIERITGGLVPANGWEDIADEPPASESKPNGHEGAA
jgi:hypothetical protein